MPSETPAPRRVKSKYQPTPVIGFAARKAATDILGRVIRGGRPLDLEIDPESGHPSMRAMIVKDRALVRALLGTALRRRGQIAMVLEELLERPIPEKTGRIDDILHIAVAQILFMDVPDHAAVTIAVSITEQDRRGRPYKGLVNGVLRRIAREKDDLLRRFDRPELAAPSWLFDSWTAAYGPEEAHAIAAMHLLEPNLDLSVKSDPQGWADKLGGFVVGKHTVRLTAHSGRIEKLEGFGNGEWWVQDVAASLPARLLGDISGKRVGDLCAAPGGKTCQLAAFGAHVTAIDISASRLKRVSQNLGRLGLEASVVAADLRYFTPDEPYDAILLDAPCSATGTIRRHPDVAWSKTPVDIEVLAAIQADMLDRAFTWLKPGGTMVFCTCSMEPQEGERQIADFLARTPAALRIPIAIEEVGGIEGIVTADGDLRTLPNRLPREPREAGGMDAFFAARIRRVDG
ncbi:methyltransferase domain-containing protein [Stappia sp. F7233]|uniref:Methyltransferase domain-containing protein n=1 Tax=Stappia albiluteola TaxID=2758565 RepID=A0A839AHW0_9HYPH|nr:transcription antitermination factor NusB [Stappia albiluteola]MBA5778618.1 methyltransferase domain-containing protein [Stappia albiluteola]